MAQAYYRGLTHSKFPSPANDYIGDRIDLNPEFVPSPMSTEQLVVAGDAMRGIGLFDVDLVLFDRAKLPSPGRCVVSMDEWHQTVRRVQGRPPKVSLVATACITPPIWFGQGSDPEILGTVTVGVHHLAGWESPEQSDALLRRILSTDRKNNYHNAGRCLACGLGSVRSILFD